MGLLEQLVVSNRTCIAFTLFLFYGFSVFSQTSKPSSSPENIGLFPKSGFEPLAPHKSIARDKSNIKPDNFRFSETLGKSLNDLLSIGLSKVLASCKPSWGLFKFRINGKGLIDSTWFDGQLPKEVSTQILVNIRATEGSWIVTPGTREEDVAWYAYFYSDTRGILDSNLNCPESDKELQTVVSAITGYFYNLYYWVGEDKATIVRPISNDGQPKH